MFEGTYYHIRYTDEEVTNDMARISEMLSKSKSKKNKIRR